MGDNFQTKALAKILSTIGMNFRKDNPLHDGRDGVFLKQFISKLDIEAIKRNSANINNNSNITLIIYNSTAKRNTLRLYLMT